MCRPLYNIWFNVLMLYTTYNINIIYDTVLILNFRTNWMCLLSSGIITEFSLHAMTRWSAANLRSCMSALKLMLQTIRSILWIKHILMHARMKKYVDLKLNVLVTRTCLKFACLPWKPWERILLTNLERLCYFIIRSDL